MDDNLNLMSIPQLLLITAAAMIVLPLAVLVAAVLGIFMTSRVERDEPVNCAGCGRSLGLGPRTLTRMSASFECPSCRYVVVRVARGT
jgi:predicted RNA-binding Zn-ribbon protein involved in translation (DUF1610 family)